MRLWRLQSKAFSLLEIMMMISLSTILFLITAPTVSTHLDSWNLDQTRHTLKQVFRRIEGKAVAEDTTYRAILSVASNRYDTYYWNGSQFVVEGGDTFPTGITLQSTTFTNDTVDFDALGSPSQGGSVVLSDRSGASRQVDIVAGSGIIRLP